MVDIEKKYFFKLYQLTVICFKLLLYLSPRLKNSPNDTRRNFNYYSPEIMFQWGFFSLNHYPFYKKKLF